MTFTLLRSLRWFLGLAFSICACASALATTVRPPSFEDLVQRADHVYHGRILEHSAYLDSHEGRTIVRTEVLVEVIEPIAGGDTAERRVLRFLGGKAEGYEMIVDGMPDLAVGTEVVLFERGNGRRLCPVVSWSYGHLRISRNAQGGAPRVRRADFTPLRSSADVAKPLFQKQAQAQALRQGAEAMSLRQLIVEIQTMRGGES